MKTKVKKGNNLPVIEKSRSCQPFDHEHTLWTSVLSQYVNKGYVNYSGLKLSGEAMLSKYLRSIEAACAEDYIKWTDNQKLAFWINAYNACTVRLVLDEYPAWRNNPLWTLPAGSFKKRFIPSKEPPGQAISLNHIENMILRKEFSEPRIHFAISCASRSCPALRSEAYRDSELEEQLEMAAMDFLRDDAKNRFDPASGTLFLSSVFKWFKEDFEGKTGTLPRFAARYLKNPPSNLALDENIRVEFIDYDWSLNGS